MVPRYHRLPVSRNKGNLSILETLQGRILEGGVWGYHTLLLSYTLSIKIVLLFLLLFSCCFVCLFVCFGVFTTVSTVLFSLSFDSW